MTIDRDRPSTPRSSATGASCTCTATGCSAPSRRPRTRCRTHCCARGGRATRSRATGCARGCTRSPRTSASTRCGAPSAACRSLQVARRGAVAAAVSGPAARRDRAERGAAGRRRRRARDDRADLHGADPAPAAAPARGADPARRARVVGDRDRGHARTERAPRPTARSSAPARRCATARSRSARTRRSSSATTSSGCSRASWPPTRAATPPRPRRAAARGHPRLDAAEPGVASTARENVLPLIGKARRDGRRGALVPTRANRQPAAASYLRRPGRHRVARVQARRPALRAATGSPRSRRSARRCSAPSGSRRRCEPMILRDAVSL